MLKDGLLLGYTDVVKKESHLQKHGGILTGCGLNKEACVFAHVRACAHTCALTVREGVGIVEVRLGSGKGLESSA